MSSRDYRAQPREYGKGRINAGAGTRQIEYGAEANLIIDLDRDKRCEPLRLRARRKNVSDFPKIAMARLAKKSR